MIDDASRVLRTLREMSVTNRLTSRQVWDRGAGRQGRSCDALCHVIFRGWLSF